MDFSPKVFLNLGGLQLTVRVLYFLRSPLCEDPEPAASSSRSILVDAAVHEMYLTQDSSKRPIYGTSGRKSPCLSLLLKKKWSLKNHYSSIYRTVKPKSILIFLKVYGTVDRFLCFCFLKVH